MDKETGTSKLIGRTAWLTFFTIVMALMLSFLILALSAPKLIGDFANRIGWGGVSVSFSRGQYERSKDVDDLADLCERSIKFGKYEVSAEYLEELIGYDRDGESLQTLAARKNASKDPILSHYDYEKFVLGNYAYSLYKTGEKDAALAFAGERTDRYLSGNALGYIADAFVEDAEQSKEKDRLSSYGLIAVLEAREREAEQGSSELKNLCIDLYRCYRALGNTGKTAEYEAKLLAFVGA